MACCALAEARWAAARRSPGIFLFDLGDIFGIILISRLAGRPSMLEIYFLKSFNVGDIVPVTKIRKTVDGLW